MFTRACILVLCLSLSLSVRAADLPTAPSEDLLKVYAQLRSLHGSTQWAVTENVAWRRDAATFTFQDGHLTFAEPVGGRVLAAYFEGQGLDSNSSPHPRLATPTRALRRRARARGRLPASRLLFHGRFRQPVAAVDENWRRGQCRRGDASFRGCREEIRGELQRLGGTTSGRAILRCATCRRACWLT